MARSSNTVYLVSFAAHVAGGIGLALVKPPPPKTEEVIEISTFDMEKKKEEQKPEPEPEEAPAPAPKAAKAAPAPAPVVQNIGFVVSGGGGGPGGIAVPVAPQPVVRQEARQVASVAPTCADPEVKAKALSMPKPVYSDEARAAQIQGKVRVQLTIDAEGRVTDATVLEGLGHGLDEAALAAVREAKFTPAQRCGKPVSSTFSVAIRFAL